MCNEEIQSLGRDFITDLSHVKTQTVICSISLTGPEVGKLVF